MDKNNDGEISYYDALDYAKFYLDTLASEGKIVRSWFPDEEVAWAVDSAMRDIMWTELPVAEKDQMVYALTMETTMNPYVLTDIIMTSFEEEVCETQDEGTDYEYEWCVHFIVRDNLPSKAKELGIKADKAELYDVFDSLDTNGTGMLSRDEVFQWVCSETWGEDNCP